MQRSLFGLLLVSLFGAVLGAVSSWPERVTDSAKAGATLLEFQTRALTARHSGAVSQPSLAFAVEAERMAPDQTPAAESPAPAGGEASRGTDPGSNTSAQTARFALAQSNGAPGAGGTVLSQPMALPTIPNVPQQEVRPTETLTPSNAAPVQALAAVIDTTAPAQTPPALSTGPAAITDDLRPPDRVSGNPATGGTEKSRTQASNEAGTESRQTLLAGRHFKQMSIHYHGDARSRTDAQEIASQLGSVHPGKIEIRSTARTVPSSEVRYFSQPDAIAASALAKALGSKSMVWRVKDCTNYRRKPAPGTVQIWLASADTSPHQPIRKASR